MLQSCRLRSIAGDRRRGSLRHRRRLRRQRREQAAAVAIAALAQHLDRRQPIGLAAAIGKQQRRRARLLHAVLHAGIALARQGAVQRRQRGGVVRVEHRLGGGEARRRIRREQAQAAERRLHLAAHRVVHPHRLEAARHDIGGRLAGRRIDERAIIGLDEQRLVRGAHEQAVRLQRRQDRRRLRMAGYRQHPDTLPDRLEARRGQRGERLIARLRATRHRCQCQCGHQQQAGKTLHCHAFRKRLGVAREEQATPM